MIYLLYVTVHTEWNKSHFALDVNMCPLVFLCHSIYPTFCQRFFRPIVLQECVLLFIDYTFHLFIMWYLNNITPQSSLSHSGYRDLLTSCVPVYLCTCDIWDLKTLTVKNIVFCDDIPCIVIYIYRRFGSTYCLNCTRRRFLRNVVKCLPCYTASYPIRQY